MSDPYVYTPRVNYRNSPYLAPFSVQANSPFIPNLNLGGSPYIPNIPLSPNISSAPSPFVPFPTSSVDDDDDYYSEPYARPRTTSWTTGVVPENIPNVASWYPPRRPQRRRSRSDAGYFDQPQVVNINNGYWVSPALTYSPLPPATPQLAIHPYLDGSAPRGDIFFDLTAPSFAPMRRLSNNQYIFITHEELSQVSPSRFPKAKLIVGHFGERIPSDLVRIEARKSGTLRNTELLILIPFLLKSS